MKATKISQMRDQLAEHEITEVWPSKAYKALCEQCGEEGWLDEEEIRTYFAELSDDEVGYVWGDTFGWDEEEEVISPTSEDKQRILTEAVRESINELVERLKKDLADFGGLTGNRLYLLNEIKDALDEEREHEIDWLNENAAYQADPEGAIRDADNWRTE